MPNPLHGPCSPKLILILGYYDPTPSRMARILTRILRILKEEKEEYEMVANWPIPGLG